MEENKLSIQNEISNEELYHLGASIKDLGKNCFGINKIEDKEIIEKIINL